MHTSKYLVVGLCLALAGFAISSAFARDEFSREDLAQTAAEAWLKQTDAGKYDVAYDAAAPLLRKAIAKEQFAKSVAAARDPLGKLVSRKVKSRTYAESLPGAPDGKYVVIQFETEFEHKKAAIETVTPMADENGQYHVSGYFIK